MIIFYAFSYFAGGGRAAAESKVEPGRISLRKAPGSWTLGIGWNGEKA
jgi:hypothetical protein